MLKHVFAAAALLTVAAATPIQPGKWTTTVTILDMTMANGPPGLGVILRGHPTSMSSCITPAQAAQGPHAAVERSGGNCRYTSFSMAAGRIQSTMVCNQGGGAMTMRATGTYTPTSMSMEATGRSTGPNAMTMRSRTVSRRTGGC